MVRFANADRFPTASVTKDTPGPDYAILSEFGPPEPIRKKGEKGKKAENEDGSDVPLLKKAFVIVNENPEKASSRATWIPTEENAKKPGPEHYNPNWKVTSAREWYPKISFTQARKFPRNALQYLSADHVRALVGEASPGPKYELPTSDTFTSFQKSPEFSIASRVDESALDKKIKQSRFLHDWVQKKQQKPWDGSRCIFQARGSSTRIVSSTVGTA